MSEPATTIIAATPPPSGFDATDMRSKRKLDLCEGPVWDSVHQRLSWVDIDNGAMFAIDDGVFREASFPGPLSAAIPFDSNSESWLIACENTLAVATMAGMVEPLWRGTKCCKYGRFNDAQCDPQGVVFAGRICTRGAHCGDVVRLNRDNTVDVVIEDVGLANGMCWSDDGATMYFVDSRRRTIMAYDYDQDRGIPGASRLVRRFGGVAEPDGITIDSEGVLWVAMWGAGTIIRLTDDGEILEVLDFAHRFPTSCCFGRPTMDSLFVTFASDPERGLDGFITELKSEHIGVPSSLFEGAGNV